MWAKVGGQRKVGCWESTPWQGNIWLSIRGIDVWSARKLSSGAQSNQDWWTGAQGSDGAWWGGWSACIREATVRWLLGPWQGCRIAEGLETLSGVETTGCPHHAQVEVRSSRSKQTQNSNRTGKLLPPVVSLHRPLLTKLNAQSQGGMLQSSQSLQSRYWRMNLEVIVNKLTGTWLERDVWGIKWKKLSENFQ